MGKLTSAQLKTSTLAICDLFGNTISSPGSAFGHSPAVAPASPTTSQSGPALAPANLSARQAKAAGLLTSGTYGRRSSISSAHDVLNSSWVNRLRAETDLLGSTLYKTTWKARALPSGRLIPALRASAHRISDNALTGWPTPDGSVAQDGETFATWDKRRLETKARVGNGNGFGTPLTIAAQMAGWPTPMAGTPAQNGNNEAGNNDSSRKTVALLSGWPTPTAKIKAGGEYKDPDKAMARAMGPHANDLRDFAQLAGWATPRSNESGHSTGNPSRAENHKSRLEDQVFLTGPARRTASGQILTGSSAAIKSGGQLSPAHSLWLMLGPFATAYLRCAERVIRSTSRKPRRS